MAKPMIVALVVSVAALAVASCSRGGGAPVHDRVVSPDGRLEAVLMTCPMAGDAKVKLVTGAVFADKGRDCADLAAALGSVRVSAASEEGEGPMASVEWDEAKAVFSFDGDRTVISREARAGAPLDLIVVRGDFKEADIVPAP